MKPKLLLLSLVIGPALLAGVPRPAVAQNTCNGFLAIGYTAAQPFAVPGDTVRVQLTLGSGSVQGGTQLTIDRVRFELDCDIAGPLGIGCTDDTAIVQYQGDSTITTTCAGVTFSSNFGNVPGSSPNQVVFDASPNIAIPANTPNFCALEFDVQVLSLSTDLTPQSIEEVAGYSVTSSDAVCDNGLASGSSQSGAITLCPTCDDDDACTTETCNQTTGQCETTDTTTCDDGDACTTEVCNTSTGACDTTATVTCADPSCEACNPQTGSCEPLDPLPAECAPIGCRITAGGITPDGRTDPGTLADVRKATFGGQVGAPCGCIGCFDEFDHVQGQWTHVRHRRVGRLHASDYNSLVCGCDGVLDGNLCNPDDRVEGPEPRPAPANVACFTGVGEFRRTPVAFRVEVEDRGEPGAGANADNTEDVYRIRIWIPTGSETPESLAAQACCTTSVPDIRNPDVDDGGNIVHGNIQIHPQLRHSEEGICPVPSGSCVE